MRILKYKNVTRIPGTIPQFIITDVISRPPIVPLPKTRPSSPTVLFNGWKISYYLGTSWKEMIVSNKAYPVALKPFLQRIGGDVKDCQYGLENKN